MIYSKSIKEKLRLHFHEVFRTKKSPRSIALGFSLGSLIALLPIPFIDFFIGLLLIAIFPKINKYALILGILIWNPFTKIPIYTFSYKIGDIIFGSSPIIQYKLSLLSQIYMYSRRFLVGNIVLAVSISLVSYLIVYLLARLFLREQGI